MNTLLCDLVSETVRTFGSAQLRVSGTSMTPAVRPGDLLFIEYVDFEEISIGQIVLYVRDGTLITHRVVEKASVQGSPRLVTRGDRVVQNDFPVSPDDLLGRVTFIVRDSKRYQPVEHPSVPKQLLCRMLRASGSATSIYLRLAEFWRALAIKGARWTV